MLVVASLAALLVSAVLVTLIVRWSLRPLDEVSGLARRITAGQRGERSRPDRTDTEIGQTAQALDEMLDELEGAEPRARRADERSRQFLADAAHELRTPVAGMSAAAESLLHAGADLGRPRNGSSWRRWWSGRPAGRAGWSPTCWPSPGSTPGSSAGPRSVRLSQVAARSWNGSGSPTPPYASR